MRFEQTSFRLRSALLALTLLSGCSEVLGLQDGRDQGACETSAECAPGYECRANACSLCPAGAVCDDVSPAGGGGSGATGGQGTSGDESTSGGSGGSTSLADDGGEASLGGAGGEPAQSGGASNAGMAGTGGRPINIPPLPF